MPKICLTKAGFSSLQPFTVGAEITGVFDFRTHSEGKIGKNAQSVKG